MSSADWKDFLRTSCVYFVALFTLNDGRVLDRIESGNHKMTFRQHWHIWFHHSSQSFQNYRRFKAVLELNISLKDRVKTGSYFKLLDQWCSFIKSYLKWIIKAKNLFLKKRMRWPWPCSVRMRVAAPTPLPIAPLTLKSPSNENKSRSPRSHTYTQSLFFKHTWADSFNFNSTF